MHVQYVLGNGGTVLMLTIVFMAVTSAGSAEMMAVGSLCTYDVYKVHCPYTFLPSKRNQCGVLQPQWDRLNEA